MLFIYVFSLIVSGDAVDSAETCNVETFIRYSVIPDQNLRVEDTDIPQGNGRVNKWVYSVQGSPLQQGFMSSPGCEKGSEMRVSPRI
jgi:hypothetical protein